MSMEERKVEVGVNDSVGLARSPEETVEKTDCRFDIEVPCVRREDERDFVGMRSGERSVDGRGV